MAFLMMLLARWTTFQETFQIEITKSYGMNAGCSAVLCWNGWREAGGVAGFLYPERRIYPIFEKIHIILHSNLFKFMKKSTKIASWLLLSFSGATARIGTKTSSDCWFAVVVRPKRRGFAKRVQLYNDANDNGDETSNKRQLNDIISS